MRSVLAYIKLANLIEQAVRRDWRTLHPGSDMSLSSLCVLASMLSTKRQRFSPSPPRSASELAQLLGCPRPRIAMELRQLLKKGWIERVAERERDKRERHYALAAEGLDVAVSARGFLVAFDRRVSAEAKLRSNRVVVPEVVSLMGTLEQAVDSQR